MNQATFVTHEVFNQSPPFEDVDLYALDRPLVEAVAANGGVAAQGELSEFGKVWGWWFDHLVFECPDAAPCRATLCRMRCPDNENLESV